MADSAQTSVLLKSLPVDCLEHVLSFLELAEIGTVLQVCRHFSRLSGFAWVAARSPFALLHALEKAPARLRRWVLAGAGPAHACVDNFAVPAVWHAEVRELLARAPPNPIRDNIDDSDSEDSEDHNDHNDHNGSADHKNRVARGGTKQTMPAGIFWSCHATVMKCVERDSLEGLLFLAARCKDFCWSTVGSLVIQTKAVRIFEHLCATGRLLRRPDGVLFSRIAAAPLPFYTVYKDSLPASAETWAQAAFWNANAPLLAELGRTPANIRACFVNSGTFCYAVRLLLDDCATACLPRRFWQEWAAPAIAQLEPAERVDLFASFFTAPRKNLPTHLTGNSLRVIPAEILRGILAVWPDFSVSNPFFPAMFVAAGLAAAEAPEFFDEFVAAFLSPAVSVQLIDYVLGVNYDWLLDWWPRAVAEAWDCFDRVLGPELFSAFTRMRVCEIFGRYPANAHIYAAVYARMRARAFARGQQSATRAWEWSVFISGLPDNMIAFLRLSIPPAEVSRGLADIAGFAGGLAAVFDELPASVGCRNVLQSKIAGLARIYAAAPALMRTTLALSPAAEAFAKWLASGFCASMLFTGHDGDSLLFVLNVGIDESGAAPWLLAAVSNGLFSKVCQNDSWLFPKTFTRILDAAAPDPTVFAAVVSAALDWAPRASMMCGVRREMLAEVAKRARDVLRAMVARAPAVAAVVVLSGIDVGFDVWETAGIAETRASCESLLGAGYVVESAAVVDALAARKIDLAPVMAFGGIEAVRAAARYGLAVEPGTVMRLMTETVDNSPAIESLYALVEIIRAFWPNAYDVADVCDTFSSVSPETLFAAARQLVSPEGW